jgi:hypothetical protein
VSGCCRPHPLSTAAASIRCCRRHWGRKKYPATVVHHDRHLPPLPSAAAAVTAVKEKSDRRTQPPSSVSTTAMWHPSKGVIHLDGDSSSNESVGSDVEEVVMWDHSLRSLMMFQRAVLILFLTLE